MAIWSAGGRAAWADNFLYVNHNTAPANFVSTWRVSADGVPTQLAAVATGGAGPTGGIFPAANRITSLIVGSRLYVTNVGSNSISGFTIDPVTGALTAIPGSPFASGTTIGASGSLSASADGRLLAVGASNLAIHSIDPLTGALAPIPGSPYALGADPPGIALSPKGDHLAAAVSGSVRLYTVGPAGLSQVGSSVSLPLASSVDFTCNGSRLLAGSVAALRLFNIGSGGLTLFGAAGAGAGAALGVSDMVAYGNAATAVHGVAITSTGLSPLAGSPFLTGATSGTAGPIAVSGDAGFLYAAFAGFIPMTGSTGAIALFRVNASGTLTLRSRIAGFTSIPGVAAYPGKYCDVLAPVTAASLDPEPNASGWNNTGVTVTLVAADEPGGSGVASIHYTLSGAETGSATVSGDTASIPISAEGETTVTFHAVDASGNAEPEQTLTVRIDLTPPTASCTVTPEDFWPPNHKLRPVAVEVTVGDDLSGPGMVTLAATSSNEPDNGLGDGDTPNDIQGFTVGEHSVTGLLRAERAGTGSGRVYTLSYEATDIAGHTAACTATVTVPHDQRKK